jgi:DNA-binding beta-propeller fold protein YncE
LYVSNRDSQTLSVLDAQGNILQTIPFPGSPAAMQWDGERLWVADRLGDSVYTFAPDGTLLDQYVVGEVPISISYAPQDGYMWIALYDASQVVVLDRAGAEVFRLDLPAKPSTVVAHPLSYANVALYGAADRPSDQVITVSVEGKILEDFAYTLYDYPNELVLDGNLLYVAYDMILGDGSSLVTQIDLASGITVDMVVEDGKVIEMAAVDRHLWLTLDSNAVIAIEIDEDYYFEEVVRLPTPARPFGITYAEPYLWVTNRGTAENPGNTIMRIDLVALLGE